MPPVTVFLNPRRGRATPGARRVSRRALEIRYVHASDGENYVHAFKPGVHIEFLSDGSARLYRPDGKPLWRDF